MEAFHTPVLQALLASHHPLTSFPKASMGGRHVLNDWTSVYLSITKVCTMPLIP
ncbi:hypothetical protein COCC4DRAFT_32693 [Bipolaris maydis ATCC 48331]|uniref:Uncharacterized protein n=2 Tax=Cochliobolus heterostrophus TaxID=5016 RepID=M2SP52_COCH5|nr:uncharacterized protein COCC4DRAFT_32693 [Bipolaris maydis ATCC 48331]EMD87110.1 hypothetical protein COCHEDRAFT_1023805 [Bipolaris maydis C5]ENI03896.1 hypothetical protein COCC4DRAFT_32693 [Bipolaris maydis ATCC 48331]